MTTHIESSQTINHPAEKVLAALGDRNYWEHEVKNILDVPGEVNSFADDPIEAVLFEVLPSDALPEAVRGVVGRDLKLKRVVSFSALEGGNADGTMKAEVKGAPVTFTARLSIVGEGESTTLSAEADIDVNVPMVGPVIEPKVAEVVGNILTDEQKLIDAWLSGNA